MNANLPSGTMPVEERHRIDEAALATWLTAHVPGYEGPLSVLQFKGGQSNPTYRLNTPRQSYVLRRKPFGKLLPSAHAVDREFRVISGLHAQSFAVPRPYALCTDDSVIGSAFYVMDMVEGRVLWNGAVPDASPSERAAIYESMISTLAKLHQFDPAQIGLADYGKPGNYFARQIDRWTKQYRASETEKNEAAERLIEFLPRTVPAQERTSIVHGDYRIDNMVFAPSEPRVVAVLDWELSTLGDPLADFTYFLVNWMLPQDGRACLGGADLKALGIPSLEQIAARYCALTGRSGIPDLNWYFAYNLFRFTAILQGIAGRMRDGTASSARAAESVARIPALSKAALDFAIKAGA
ncbi:MAG TPA: phosphotransferase family protein [Magnetospirillaceae bacterium]|jgi:aminoglycoside phosphotransferase (APT) family kinase protein